MAVPETMPLRDQLGVTILEFMAFIGLVAIVTSGALAFGGSPSVGMRVSELTNMANGMVASVLAVYAMSNVPNWQAAAISVVSPQGLSGKASPFAKGPCAVAVSGGGISGTITGVGNVAEERITDAEAGSIINRVIRRKTNANVFFKNTNA